MAKLIYAAIASLDGYVADEDGNFDWAEPDEEVHRFVNDLERPVGTYLYGRRMYETMVYWETANAQAGQRPVARDYAEIWQSADKVVYSRTLEGVSSARTRIERDFDPEAVRQLKAAAGADLRRHRRPGARARSGGAGEPAGEQVGEAAAAGAELGRGAGLDDAARRRGGRRWKHGQWQN